MSALDSMTEASPLGEFEQVVLLAILRLGDEAYASRCRTKSCAAPAATSRADHIYITLDRLEPRAI
jgi:hypothetical protein